MMTNAVTFRGITQVPADGSASRLIAYDIAFPSAPQYAMVRVLDNDEHKGLIWAYVPYDGITAAGLEIKAGGGAPGTSIRVEWGVCWLEGSP